jgi:hypothetical protein
VAKNEGAVTAVAVADGSSAEEWWVLSSEEEARAQEVCR